MHGLCGNTVINDITYSDSIDHASKIGVSYVVQPGGSVADEEVVLAHLLIEIVNI